MTFLSCASVRHLWLQWLFQRPLLLTARSAGFLHCPVRSDPGFYKAVASRSSHVVLACSYADCCQSGDLTLVHTTQWPFLFGSSIPLVNVHMCACTHMSMCVHTLLSTLPSCLVAGRKCMSLPPLCIPQIKGFSGIVLHLLMALLQCSFPEIIVRNIINESCNATSFNSSFQVDMFICTLENKTNNT